MTRQPLTELLGFYRQALFGDLLSFWMGRGIDREKGGFFTCFSNDGAQLLHTHKFVWSQGRFVWMLSRLADRYRQVRPAEEVEGWLAAARGGARFLIDHALLKGDVCSFVLDREGNPVLLNPDGTSRAAGPGEEYDQSIYADFFALYGVSEYARVARDRAAYDFCVRLFRSIEKRIASHKFKSFPYPIPEGYKMHGVPMISLETYQEFADTADLFGDPVAVELREKCGGYAADILENFCRPDHLVSEFLLKDNRVPDNLLGTYFNPGHTLEDMWFVIHWAVRINNFKAIQKALLVIQRTVEAGWDKEFGGFPQFLSRAGGPPAGPVPPELKDSEMIRKLQHLWDSKLWWPHSEALYALLLAYEQTREDSLLEAYWKVHDYTFKTFPNPDKSVGEWIQIRDRRGNPEEKVVALPVKDPFHITRNFIHILDVLKRLA